MAFCQKKIILPRDKGKAGLAFLVLSDECEWALELTV